MTPFSASAPWLPPRTRRTGFFPESRAKERPFSREPRVTSGRTGFPVCSPSLNRMRETRTDFVCQARNQAARVAGNRVGFVEHNRDAPPLRRTAERDACGSPFTEDNVRSVPLQYPFTLPHSAYERPRQRQDLPRSGSVSNGTPFLRKKFLVTRFLRTDKESICQRLHSFQFPKDGDTRRQVPHGTAANEENLHVCIVAIELGKRRKFRLRQTVFESHFVFSRPPRKARLLRRMHGNIEENADAREQRHQRRSP